MSSCCSFTIELALQSYGEDPRNDRGEHGIYHSLMGNILVRIPYQDQRPTIVVRVRKVSVL